MKVRVCYTVHASDEYRRAIAHRLQRHGELATRDEVRDIAEEYGESIGDDLMWDWQQCDEGCVEVAQ